MVTTAWETSVILATRRTRLSQLQEGRYVSPIGCHSTAPMASEGQGPPVLWRHSSTQRHPYSRPSYYSDQREAGRKQAALSVARKLLRRAPITTANNKHLAGGGA